MTDSTIDLDVTNLLTVAEVADVLRTSKMTVYRIIHDPDNPLHALKVRGSFRVPQSGLDAYLRAVAVS